MAAYNTNDLARIYRKARGVGENALSMLTSGFAEPAAGYAAAAAAATGYDAEGARNAIRERMTYAPKTAEGIQYMNALARVMSAVNNSAPVTTWKKGVDIAGRYSPTAGAVLASAPTAIGVATGAKSALRQGRSASILAQRMQEGMVNNAMAPRKLHPQAGVISTGPMPKRVMSDTAKKAYELGVKHREAMEKNPNLTLMDIMYTSDAADSALNDLIYKQGYELSAAAYESGRRGAKIPTLAKGLRYGKAPESGFSFNKATGDPEQGVSMAKVDGVNYEWYPVSDSKTTRKPINYEGYLLDPDHFWGGDGEPLMLRVIEVDGK